VDTFEINLYFNLLNPKKSPVGGDGEKLIDYGMICSLVSSRTGLLYGGKVQARWRKRGDSG
jgi:hypothetical protein